MSLTPRGRGVLLRGDAFPGKVQTGIFYSGKFTIYQFFFIDMCYNNYEPVRKAHCRAASAIFAKQKVHAAVMLYE